MLEPPTFNDSVQPALSNAPTTSQIYAEVEASNDKAVDACPAFLVSVAMLLFSFFCSAANFAAVSFPCAAWICNCKTVASSLRTLFLIFPFYSSPLASDMGSHDGEVYLKCSQLITRGSSDGNIEGVRLGIVCNVVHCSEEVNVFLGDICHYITSEFVLIWGEKP